MSSSKSWLIVGALLAGLAVVQGAFAAHRLDTRFAEQYAEASPKTVAGFSVPTSWKYLQDFKTGAEYQMYHALGLIAVGLLGFANASTRWMIISGWSFLLGIVFFSGSLYALTLTGITRFGMIAPIGGTLFIIGWVALAMAARTCSIGHKAG